MMAPPEVDTVFEAAARRPDGLQFGFCFAGIVSSVPWKASFCEGSGRFDLGLLDLLLGRGDRERDIVLKKSSTGGVKELLQMRQTFHATAMTSMTFPSTCSPDHVYLLPHKHAADLTEKSEAASGLQHMAMLLLQPILPAQALKAEPVLHPDVRIRPRIRIS